MATLRLVARELSYPMSAQLFDLGVLDEVEVMPPMGVSRAVLSAQITRILDAASMVRPGMGELARTLLDSCNETGHLGRWRARLFDLPVGRKYPRVGYHGLEVLRWRGAAAGTGKRLSGPNTAATKDLRDVVSELIPAEESRRFYAGPDVWARQSAGAWERAEVIWRLRKTLPLVSHNRYGIEGDLHRFLVHQSDSENERHIFLEPAGNHVAPDPATSAQLYSSAPGPNGRSIRQLVVVSPPSSGGVALSRLIASGLGWDSLSINQMVGTFTGLSYRVNHGMDRNRFVRRAVDQILLTPLSSPTVYTISAPPMDESSHPISALQQLIHDDATVLIVVQPNEATAVAWYERQLRNTPSMRSTAAVNRAATMMRKLSQLSEYLSRDGVHVATATTTIALNWNSEEYFEDPDVGDHRLRAAYEICHLLIHGRLPGQRPTVTGFVDGSALKLYEEKLRREARDREVPSALTFPVLKLKVKEG